MSVPWVSSPPQLLTHPETLLLLDAVRTEGTNFSVRIPPLSPGSGALFAATVLARDPPLVGLPTAPLAGGALTARAGGDEDPRDDRDLHRPDTAAKHARSELDAGDGR